MAFSKFSGTQLSGCGVFARPRYHVKPVRCCPCSKYYHILRMTQPRLRQKEEIPYINMSCNIRESTKCDVYFIYKIDHIISKQNQITHYITRTFTCCIEPLKQPLWKWVPQNYFLIFFGLLHSLSLSRAAWLVAVSQRRPLLHSVAKSLWGAPKVSSKQGSCCPWCSSDPCILDQSRTSYLLLFFSSLASRPVLRLLGLKL